MFKKLAKKLLVGNKFLQKLYVNLHKLALAGMQFGYSKSVTTSGEVYALKYIYKKLQTKQQIVVFDVGAHEGEYSASCINVFGSRLLLFAFEPSQKSYNRLFLKLPIAETIKTFNIGLHKESTELTLYTTVWGSKVASVYNQDSIISGKKFLLAEKIKVDTVDNICVVNKVDFIDLLKLDTEGNEFDVLLGARKMIENNKIAYIQFEFGHCNIASRTYFYDFYKMLSDKYYFYRILRRGLYKISDYSPSQEIFLNVNYLAELKVLSSEE